MEKDTSPGLDAFDYKIMSEMQQKGLIPLRQIGDSVGLSVAAVQRRHKRLLDEGYLFYSVILSPEKLGVSLTVVAEISLLQNVGTEIASFEKILLDPRIQQSYRIAGDSDYIVIMKLASLDAYNQLCDELFSDITIISKLRTLVVQEVIKASQDIVF